ncbi:F-box/kelch-repeat protein At1g57790-like [Corylus avellana]|uniref:F-box/kelch-repeat protein At1g57790-like n=1 Tax=Corylus avellana TaxID=13451 RepID=UPI00286A87A6|nr:F-box/kelch-repeat protein At1g57790-like [Corylus avellana]XP_059463108.1 F-box/kelch-repeat protein At1g57790-like [Corylus avellana]
MTMKEKKEKLELSWSDLPIELLELIISRLPLDDNVHASVVCKSWHSAAISVRVVNQSPWLMYFYSGNLYIFYDPLLCKTHSIILPELNGCRVRYSKDGWLLVYRPISHCLFFFNPFTREEINLPSFRLNLAVVAFSCAPTSTNCIILAVKQVGHQIVAISTCHPGATEWVTVTFRHHLPISSFVNKFVFCDELFYCLGFNDGLGFFDPLQRTWNVLAVLPPELSGKLSIGWLKGRYMTVHKGELLLIYARSGSANPIMFKLNRTRMIWEEVKTLDGFTLFASSLSSHLRMDIPGGMRNSIYFPKVCLHGKHCISYSFDNCRDYPCNQCHDLGDHYDPPENIWIDPPQDFTGFT